MPAKPKTIRPSDLPTKIKRAPDGTLVRMKVVQSDSPTLDEDMLAAFRSNVRRVRAAQRLDRQHDADPAQA